MQAETWKPTISVFEFELMHNVLLDAANAPGLTDAQRATVGDDLSRLCDANPEAYEAFLQRQAADFEAVSTTDQASFGY